ncbi:MAG: L,D-transpeptidase family protein [Verrucomicrobiota bacterium]
MIDSLPLPRSTSQLILALADSQDSMEGRLQCYSRSRLQPWTPIGAERLVSLGQAGMAWGLGRHQIPEGAPVKREGDGKSPCGIFTLGFLFGEELSSPNRHAWPYRASTAEDYWVDDPASPDYNGWVHLPSGQRPKDHWSSFEQMKRPDGLYEWGLVIHHNAGTPIPGAGSAIFLHRWKGQGQATSGCIATDRSSLLHVIQWIDPGRSPLLLLIPRSWVGLLKLSNSARPLEEQT